MKSDNLSIKRKQIHIKAQLNQFFSQPRAAAISDLTPISSPEKRNSDTMPGPLADTYEDYYIRQRIKRLTRKVTM